MWPAILGWAMQVAGLILGWLRSGQQATAQAATTSEQQLGATTEALQTQGQSDANAEKSQQAAAVVAAKSAADPDSVRDGSDGFSRD